MNATITRPTIKLAAASVCPLQRRLTKTVLPPTSENRSAKENAAISSTYGPAIWLCPALRKKTLPKKAVPCPVKNEIASGIDLLERNFIRRRALRAGLGKRLCPYGETSSDGQVAEAGLTHGRGLVEVAAVDD